MEVWFGLVAFLVLATYFRAVQTRWPFGYFAVVDLTGYRISASPIRYTVYRFLPVFLAAFFLGVLVVRARGNLILALGMMVTGHLILTSGRGLYALARDPTSFARRVQVLLHVVVALVVVLAAFLGGALAFVPVLRGTVPEPAEVTTALWTAALAAIGGAALVRASRTKVVDAQELVLRAKRTLRRGLWELVGEVAAEAKADPNLVRAVLVVESVQRPPWFRRLERLKGKILPRGTYGVMQVRAERPISDDESIRQSVRERFAGTMGVANGGDDTQPLRDVLRDYNPSDESIELAEQVYWHLVSESSMNDAALADWDEESNGLDTDTKRLMVLGAVGGFVSGLVVLAGLSLARSVMSRPAAS